MQKDLLIGAFDNMNYQMLSPWINSIKECGFTGDICLVCYNSDLETVDKLVAKGVHVIAFEKADHGYIHKSTMTVHTERFFHFFQILREQAVNYRYIIATDTRDVIFQKNPSEYLNDWKQCGYNEIIASSESIKYKDEPWGNENMEKTFGPYFHDYFKHNTIYNVGVIAGESMAIRDIFLNIYLMSINRPIKIVDQAVWNVMLYTEPYQTFVDFTDMSDAWAVHLGTTMDPNKIEQFRPFLQEEEPKFVNNKVVNSEDNEFVIVHQWDRVPEISKMVWEKYGEK